MSTQNKDIVQRIFDEYWLAGKRNVLDQLLASDVTNHELSKEAVSGRNACARPGGATMPSG